jgi:hypothetical protein
VPPAAHAGRDRQHQCCADRRVSRSIPGGHRRLTTPSRASFLFGLRFPAPTTPPADGNLPVGGGPGAGSSVGWAGERPSVDALSILDPALVEMDTPTTKPIMMMDDLVTDARVIWSSFGTARATFSEHIHLSCSFWHHRLRLARPIIRRWCGSDGARFTPTHASIMAWTAAKHNNQTSLRPLVPTRRNFCGSSARGMCPPSHCCERSEAIPRVHWCNIPARLLRLARNDSIGRSEPSGSQHWKCQGAPEGQAMMKRTLFAALLVLLPVCARAQAPTRCIPAVMSLSGEGESDVAVLDMRGQWHVSSWGGVTWIALHAPDEKARCLARQLLLGASKVRSDTADTRCTGDWGKFMRIVSADPLVHACRAAPSCSVGDLCS